MARTTAVGIDIGTYQVKVVVAEVSKNPDRNLPRILGTGYAESKGLRHGYIINQNEAVRAVSQAVRQAEKMSGVEIRHAFLSIGGVGLTGTIAGGSLIISRADNEIVEEDVLKVLEACENELPQSFSANRKVIHAIPLIYKIDGKSVLGRPQGMKGMRLESKTLFVTCLEQHLSDLIQVVGEAGVEVEDVMASPLAASLVTLTKTQKIAGCVLANIGAETVSIVVFENNIPVSLEVFPIGSTDITNDIALGLKIPLEDAEKLKMKRDGDVAVSKKKLEEIIVARLSDIFELIDAHLKKIGRSELLPAGIILTGGGSGLTSISDIAKMSLKLPSRLADVSFESNTKGFVKDSTWAVAYGLCILGLSQSEEPSVGLKMARKTKNKIIEWLKQFLP